MAARDPDLNPPPVPSGPPGRPDQVPAGELGDAAASDTTEGVDKKYWLECLDDAERAEQDWRKRGREIVQIYRNETRPARGNKWAPGNITFNILYANTEVMLPAIYQQPAQPVVRSRFTKVALPMPGPPPGMAMPPMGPPSPPPPQLQPGGPPLAPAAQPPLPAGGPPMGLPPGSAGPAVLPPGIGGPPIAGMPPGVAGPAAPSLAGPGGAQPIIVPPDVGMIPPAPPMPPPMPPPQPQQSIIDTAASVMEKALEIVVDDEHSHEAVKSAIKDVLLPGRGCCRVRWKPQMKTVPVLAGDGTTPLTNPDTGEPQTQEIKVWEEVDDEYVYWEDLLVDPVRATADMSWIAFRHLFTKQDLEKEFAGSKQYDALKTANRLGELFKWTDESAAQSPPGGGAGMKTASKLGDKIRKAMLWEIWDRTQRRIIWFCKDAAGMVFRVDPDSLQLAGFYPIPAPMLAVTTTDSRIPRPFFDLYARLAADLDETSARISNLTKQIKVRGGYNSASRDIADILNAADQKMIPVEGVDMLNGGLANHIWLLPILDFMNALDKLFLAREQCKQAIYEVMGISDIMRGATKASETATAQRMKGSMGASRLEDAKQQAGNFVRDLLRLKAEIIGQNFDAETLSSMTGENVTPEVMAILRSDFMRTCTIDIEADSTVLLDEQAEQQSMAMVMQSIQLVMQGTQSMLMTQLLPPQQIIQLSLALLKMALHPVRYSRAVVELIDDFQQQLMMMPLPPPPPLMPPTGPPGAQPGQPPPEPGGPPVGPAVAPPMPNGAPPPGLM